MAQMASLLAVATVFLAYGLLIPSQRRGGRLIHETKLPV